MSLLIVASVVSGTVVAGYSRIGVLKSIGFTPGQVVAVYMIQAVVPAAAGCLAGAVLGVVTAGRLVLGEAASAYGVGTLGGLPAWLAAGTAGGIVRPDRARRAAAGGQGWPGSPRSRPWRPGTRPRPVTATPRTG